MKGLLALAACCGCVNAGAFECTADPQCIRAGVVGTCESVGFCSFPDGTCTSGSRFGALSGPVANQCVGETLDARPPDDGAPAGRVTDGLSVLYTFEEGSGTTVFDVSGVSPAIDLVVGNNTAFIPGALEIQANAGATASSNGSGKVTSACIASGQSTIETWIESASASDTTAQRIFGIGGINNVSTLTLGQEDTNYYGQIRSTLESTKLHAPNGTARTTLVHVVHTRTATSRVLYIDGVETATIDTGGNLSNWDDTLPVILGASLDDMVRWRGRIYLAAIYCRALDPAEVIQNLTAGR